MKESRLIAATQTGMSPPDFPDDGRRSGVSVIPELARNGRATTVIGSGARRGPNRQNVTRRAAHMTSSLERRRSSRMYERRTPSLVRREGRVRIPGRCGR